MSVYRCPRWRASPPLPAEASSSLECIFPLQAVSRLSFTAATYQSADVWLQVSKEFITIPFKVARFGLEVESIR